VTTMTGVDASKSGNLSATKFNTSSTSLIDLTVDEKIISQYVQFNGDKTGITTENLVNIIAGRQGLAVLDGGKYGSNNGFDHVLQSPDGTVTSILDSKQISGGSAKLATDSAGFTQLSDRWIKRVLDQLDPDSGAAKAIRNAQLSGTLVKGVAGVDRNTGRPVLLEIN